nr:G282 [uncultured bacterium]
MKLERLTREAGPILTQDLGYDGAGNRQSDGIGSYVYAPSSNRQTSRPQGPVSLDPAGHTTAQAGFTYTWDGPGRLKTVRLSGTLLATYHYDARHRRTRKETTAAAPQGTATVLYAYDPDDHLLAETDAGGRIRRYIWRDDVPVAQIEHRPSLDLAWSTPPDVVRLQQEGQIVDGLVALRQQYGLGPDLKAICDWQQAVLADA